MLFFGVAVFFSCICSYIRSVRYACLIVNCETDPARWLQRELLGFDFKPHTVASCEDALALMQHWRFDAIVLDAESFGPQYRVALQRLHRRSHSPLVVLAGPLDEASQLAALESGASDIVTLPASARLIAARLRRLIETGVEPPAEVIEVSIGPLLMNARHGTAIVGDQALALTPHQFELLFLLATRRGQFVHRETIARVLQCRAVGTGRSVDAHVFRIRKALRATGVAGVRVDTAHRRGYRLSFEPATALERFDDRSAFGASSAHRAQCTPAAVGRGVP